MFLKGAEVEVFDVKRGLWIPAVVVLPWRGMKFTDDPRNTPTTSTPPRTEPDDVYDVEGTDDEGPFHGRWEARFVRARC